MLAHPWVQRMEESSLALASNVSISLIESLRIFMSLSQGEKWKSGKVEKWKNLLSNNSDFCSAKEARPQGLAFHIYRALPTTPQTPS